MKSTSTYTQFLTHLKFIFICLSLLTCAVATAQPDFSWAARAGGITTDVCNSIGFDAEGNVYATGYFQGITSFSNGAATITSNGSKDIYLASFNPAGELLWARGIGGNMEDEGLDIAVDADGNIYLTGYFRSSVNFGTPQNPLTLQVPGIFSASNAFMAKYSSTGELIWAHRFGSDGNAQGTGISIGQDGNIYLCGLYTGMVNFNTSGSEDLLISINNGSDIFMAKFTPDGELIWTKSMGGTSTDIPRAIGTDNDNNVFIAGRFDGTADFDPSASSTSFSAQLSDLFVAKYNPSGQLIWVHGVGSASFEEARDLAVDAEGNVLITGNFWGTIDFDSGDAEVLVTSNMESDVFLAKYSPDGACLWAFNIGGNASDEGRGVAVDPAGNAYITGTFAQTVDFDPSVSNNSMVSIGFFDVYVAKYNPSGDYQWAFQIGSSSSCYGNAISHDYGNSIYIGGQFAVTAEFDPMGNGFTLNSFNAAPDAFFVRYESCNSAQQLFFETLCAGETFEFEEQFYNAPGYYSVIYQNENGCDSILTLNLNLIELNNAVNIIDNGLMAEQNDAQYQWYECAEKLQLLEGETEQIFLPQQSGNYLVLITSYDCEVFSECNQVVITSANNYSAAALNQINVFPNPAKSLFQIRWNGYASANATLIDVQGKPVMPTFVLQPETTTTIQRQLAPGMYFLQLNQAENFTVVKLIVE